ncbi:hypothetical protein [Burkholderia ubonensis]|uniref:hypothetical protein n=1 Tax=Burkholderia ubonensis TaxID=101571 RepID=UPI0012FBB8E4|nr:hypothetical protein [Burkholderia ubonensis]
MAFLRIDWRWARHPGRVERRQQAAPQHAMSNYTLVQHVLSMPILRQQKNAQQAIASRKTRASARGASPRFGQTKRRANENAAVPEGTAA